MKHNQTIKFIGSKVIAALLSISMMAGISFTGMVPTVSAATTTMDKTASSGAAKPADTVTNANDLTQSSTATANVVSLGFSGNQSTMTDATGATVNKNTTNPLGASSVNLYQTLQLAVAGTDKNDLHNIWDDPILNSATENKTALNSTIDILTKDNSCDWAKSPKDMVAADINGTGKDFVVTAALVSVDKTHADLDVIIENDSINYAEQTLISSLTKPSNYSDNTESPIHITAGDYDHDGKDEIAIVVVTTLYIYKISQSTLKIGMATIPTIVSTLISKTDFSQSNFSKLLVPADGTARIDLESADTDGDGYPELLVTLGTSNGYINSNLLIYHGTDTTKPVAQIQLSTADGPLLCANVTVGDVYGTGQNTIVVAGVSIPVGAYEYSADISGKPIISTINYDASTNTYDTSATFLTNKAFYLDDYQQNYVASDLKGLKCLSFSTPSDGDPQIVVYGDVFFKYSAAANKNAGGFVKCSVSNARSFDSTDDSLSYGKSKFYVKKILVGDFDGNTKKQQQVIILDYDSEDGTSFGHITEYSDPNNLLVTDGGKKDGSGLIVSSYMKVSNVDYASICAPDVFLNGERLVYDNQSEFTFSDPTIIAVLGASPSYNELIPYYANGYGNAETTYGLENATENETSKQVTTSVGASIGFESSQDVFGVQIASEEFEDSVEDSFSKTWSKSTSISTSNSFTGYNTQDSVVVSVVPYDIYYYKEYDSIHPNGVEISINVPYAPEMNIMSLTTYNSAAKNITNAPIVSSAVLNHTVGDPRTYPSSTTGLTNVTGSNVLTVAGKNNSAFTSSGSDSTLTSQSISIGSSSGTSIEASVENEISISVTVFGAKAGVKFGAGEVSSETTTTSNSTTFDGSVAGIPTGYSNYQFQWALVVYDYKLIAGTSSQTFTVLSYMVKPSGTTLPPAVPNSFAATSKSLGTTTLSWNPVISISPYVVTGYKISRSTDGGATYSPLTTIAEPSADSISPTSSTTSTNPISPMSYTDTGLQSNTTYYYKIETYNNTFDGLTADPVSVLPLSVQSITVKTQPNLKYTNGDLLNLLNLTVDLNLSDGSSTIVNFGNFGTNNLSVNIADGTPLSASQSGQPIIITYTPSGLTANTNNLTVNASTSNTFAVNFVFNVGKTSNATKLSPNVLLSVSASVVNNQAVSQNMIFMVVLYDANGNMVNDYFVSSQVSANSSKMLTGGLTLPSNVTGYTAKASVWDGTDILSSSLIPLCDSAQITG